MPGAKVQVLDESTLLSGNMTSLYRCDRDGRNLTLVIDDSRFSFTDYLFTDGESVYTVGNPSCKESNGVLYRISLDSGKAELSCGGKKIADCKISRKAPIGISYLHLQTSRKSPDAGMYVLSVAENGF